MPSWKKVALATGTASQYIKGDGSFATYSTGLPLTGGTVSGNIKIDQGSASGNPRLTFAHDNIGTNHYIQMDRDADSMNIFVNGSNAIVIDSNQNATFSKNIIIENSSASAKIEFKRTSASTSNYILQAYSGVFELYDLADSREIWRAKDDGTFAIAQNTTVASNVTIGSSGNNGLINLKRSSDGATVGAMGLSSTNVLDLSVSGGSYPSVRFLTSGTERMRVNQDGNVGIGTNSPNISSGASGSTALTISATASEKNALIELKGTRGSSGAFNTYIRSFSNSGATPITDIVSKRGASDTKGTLELYTSNTLAVTVHATQDTTFSGNVNIKNDGATSALVLIESDDTNYQTVLANYHNAGDTFALYGLKGDYLKHIRTDDSDENTHTLRIGGAMKRVDIFTNGSQRLLIDHNGNATFAKHIILPNTYSLQWGDANARIEGSTANDSINILTGGTSALSITSNQSAVFSGDVTVNSGLYPDADEGAELGNASLRFSKAYASELNFDTGEKIFATSGYVVADGDAGFIARDSGVNKLIINGDTATFAGNITLDRTDGFVYLSNAGTGNDGAYIRSYGGGHVRLNAPASKQHEWEIGGVQKFRIESTSATFAGEVSVNGGLVKIEKSTTGTGLPSTSATDAKYRLLVRNPQLTNNAEYGIGFSSYGGGVVASISSNTYYNGEYESQLRFQTRDDGDGGLRVALTLNKDTTAVFANSVDTGSWLKINGSNTVWSATNTGTYIQAPATTEKISFRSNGLAIGAIYDASNKRFGIGGTTSPNATLHLESGNDTEIRFSFGNGQYINKLRNEWSAGTASASKMRFHISDGTNGAFNEVLTLTGDQRVGIGDNTPSSKLTLTSALGDGIRLQRSSVESTHYMLFDPDSINAYPTDGAIYLNNDTGSDVIMVTGGGNVGIGTDSPSSMLHLKSAGSEKPYIIIENTNANVNAPGLKFNKNSASPADGDELGQIIWLGDDDAGNSTGYAGIHAESADVTNGSEDGSLFFSTRVNDSSTKRLSIVGGNVGIGDATPTEGKLVIAGDGAYNNPPLHISMTSSTSFNHFANMVNPNLTAGENGIIVFGQELATKNSAYIGYVHRSDGGDDNQLTLGFWGANNLVNLLPNGNLGVGLVDPLHTLHIEKSVNSNWIAKFKNTGTTNAYGVQIDTTANTTAGEYSFAVYTGSNLGFFVTSDSKASIGTNVPTHRLTVDTVGSATDMCIGTYATGKTSGVLYTSADANGYFAIQSYYAQGSTFGDIALNPSGGWVGIGTSNPTAYLHISAGSANATGGIRLTNDDTSQTATGGTALFIEQNTKDFFIRNYEDAGIRMRTHDTDAMYIDDDQNVGIGTVTPTSLLNLYKSNASAVLTLQRREVDGALTTGDIIGQIDFVTNDDSYNSGANTTRASIKADIQSSTSASGLIFETGNSSSATAEAMYISPNGSVSVGMPKAQMSKTFHIQSNTGSAGTPNGLMLTNTVHGSDSQIYMYAENDSGTLSSGTIKYDPDAMYMWLLGSGNKGLYINHSGNTIFSESIHLLDNNALALGTGEDTQIFYDSSDSHTYFRSNVASSDIIFKVRVGSTDTQILRLDGGAGNVELGGNTHFSSGKSLHFTPTVYSSNVQGIKFDDPVVTTDSIIQPARLGSNQGIVLYLGANSYVNTSGGTDRYNDSSASSGIEIRPDNGQIRFLTNSSSADPLSRMAINSDGNVGIGTDSASSPAGVGRFLHIANSSHAGIVLDDTGSTAYDIYSADGHLYAYSEHASKNTLTLSNEGNLNIYGDNNYSQLTINSSDNSSGIRFRQSNGNVNGWIYSASYAVGLLDEGGHWTIKAQNNTGIYFYTNNGSQHMQILNSGNVGIGSTNDTYKLEVAGTNEDLLKLHNKTDGLDSLISFTNAGGTLGRIQGIDNGGLAFDTGNNAGGVNSNVMFISNDAKVGIGTTQPDKLLHVSSSDNVLATFESTDTHATVRVIDPDTSNEATLTRVGDNLEIVKDGGNVSIGKDNPAQALDVNGSIISSGVLLAPTYVTFIHSFYDDIGTTAHYLPWGNIAEGTGNDSSATSFLAPMSMTLKKLFVRIESITNLGNHNLTVTLISKADGTISNTTVASAIKAFASANSNKTVTYLESDFSATPRLSQKQLGSLKIQFGSDYGSQTDFFVTSVWQMNNNTL